MRSLSTNVLVLLLLLGTLSCTSDDPPTDEQPSWMEGMWSGRLAWEHDTTSHRLQLNLDADRFVYPSLDCSGTLQIDSTRSDVVRLRFVAAHDSLSCGDVSGGTAELWRLDGETDVLHLQYGPQATPKLYLARLRRTR